MAVVVMALALAPVASACDEPERADDPETVAGEAGAKLTFDVPGTLEGARWSVRIRGDDDELAHGVDEDSEEEGVTVAFEVPDFGEGAREVELAVEVEHETDGADWAYELRLDYRGRPEPEPEPEPEPQPEPEPRSEEPVPEPAPEPDPPAEEPAPQEPDRSDDAQAAPASAAAPPPPPPAAAPADPVSPAPPADRLQMTATSRQGSAPVAAPEPTTTGLAGPPVAAEARAAGDPRRRRGASRRHRRPVPTADPAPAPQQRAPEAAEEGGIRLPDVQIPGFGTGLAWEVIAGGALSFACAGLLLAAVARRRRRDRLALR
jgi:hypothetical protein